MEKLEIEFRYLDVYNNKEDYTSFNKFVTVGIFETIEETVKEGNNVLKVLSDRGFEIRHNDTFKVNGLFGNPNRLVSNTCYKDKVTYFAKITNLGTNNINDIINEAFEGRKRYEDFKKLEKENY